MAELTDQVPPGNTCCSTEAQAACCEPADKDPCCGSTAAPGTCGCAAGQAVDPPDIRDTVRDRYAAAARAFAAGAGSSCGCDTVSTRDASGAEVFGSALYDTDCTDDGTDDALGEFRAALTEAGLTDLEIRSTHRVHQSASSAIIRARKPASAIATPEHDDGDRALRLPA